MKTAYYRTMTAVGACAGMATLLAGCDVKLGKPQLLWLLWLVPALVAFNVYSWRTKRRLLGQFASPELIARIQSGVSGPRQLLKAALVVVAVTLALLSLSEVKYGFSWDEVKREGVDLVVALDVSDSMLVQDAEAEGKLSRLERAKRKVTDLLRLLEGDRVALVAFSGTSFVECPLTLDYAAAEVFLESIDTDLIPVKGTAIGDAIHASLKAFEGGSAKSQAIILITDGEDHSGKALEAAEEAKTQGVRIYAIGIGRDEGAPIPDANGGFRKDRRGEMVLSKLDETTLQKMALTTGGAYVRSVTGDIDLEKIYTQGIKATLEDKDLGSKRRQRWEERFQWILAAAILLLMIEPLVPERRRKTGSPNGSATAAAAMLLAALLLPGAASAQARPPAKAKSPPGIVSSPPGAPGPLVAPPPPPSAGPTGPAKTYDDPALAYADGAYDQALQGFIDAQVENPEDVGLMLDVGSAHYKMGNYAEAEKAFGRAAMAGEPKLKEQALYNLGNNAYKQGKLEDAIKLYQAALEVDPNDEDAKFNIEFVRDEIRRRHEEAQKRQEQQQQQQNQQQNQDQQQQDQQQQDQQQQDQQQQQQDQEQQQQDQQQQQQDQQQQAAGGEKKDEGEKKDGQGAEAQQAAPLTQEEAQRYLDSLGDDKPVQKQKVKASGRRQVDKDW